MFHRQFYLFIYSVAEMVSEFPTGQCVDVSSMYPGCILQEREGGRFRCVQIFRLTVQYSTVQYSVWYDMVLGTVWYGTRYSTVRYSVQYSTVLGTVQYGK